MTGKLIGLLAAVALVGASAVYADEGSKAKGTQAQSEASKSAMGEHQLTGEVVKVERNKLYVRQHNAIVPLDLDSKTQYRGIEKRDLKEGQEIRASFSVDGQTKNLAHEINLVEGEMQPGTGESESESPMSP